MPQVGLRIDQVSYKYLRSKHVILRDVTCGVEPGEILSISGKNGVGKTTLLNLVAGLYTPTSGTISFEGRTLRCAEVALINAEFDMFSYLTVEENIRFFLDFYGVDYGEDDVEVLLERYHIAAERAKFVQATSRGMRKKMQIVTALLQRPRVLLADEPLDGLDPDAQHAFLDDVAQFARDGGITLMVLHDARRESAIATGHLRLPGPDEVTASPETPSPQTPKRVLSR